MNNVIERNVDLVSTFGRIDDPKACVISRTQEKEFTVTDSMTKIFNGRNWFCIKENRNFGLRITRNAKTSEVRVSYKLTKEAINEMSRKRIEEIADNMRDNLVNICF